MHGVKTSLEKQVDKPRHRGLTIHRAVEHCRVALSRGAPCQEVQFLGERFPVERFRGESCQVGLPQGDQPQVGRCRVALCLVERCRAKNYRVRMGSIGRICFVEGTLLSSIRSAFALWRARNSSM